MAPWGGGPRVCFGKTLAETTMKIGITYITQMFDLEFEDPKFYDEELLSCFDASHREQCFLKLKLRAKK